MGFINSIKEALGGDHDHHDERADPADVISQATAPSAPVVLPRHADRDAPAEDPDAAFVATGGKHAARD